MLQIPQPRMRDVMDTLSVLMPNVAETPTAPLHLAPALTLSGKHTSAYSPLITVSSFMTEYNWKDLLVKSDKHSSEVLL